ncbi:MAG: FHA domain-containing protein [Anaerolineales bacterium]|nr:FHA domain-containing protein [Anaerolineales bacterium]
MTLICPNCKKPVLEGAIFCSECGTKLIDSGGLSTAAIQTPETIAAADEPAPKPAAPLPVSSAHINLHIIRTGQIIPLEGGAEFTLGRISEGQSIMPDIDLSPYDAYSQGVSRLHATLKVRDSLFYIEDLGSSNGTRINNNKITPLTDTLIHNGDVIALGRFKVQALIRQEN